MTEHNHEHEHGEEGHVCGGYELLDLVKAIRELDGEDVLETLGLIAKSPTGEGWKWTEKGARLSVLLLMKSIESVADVLSRDADEEDLEARQTWIEMTMTVLSTHLTTLNRMGFLEEPTKMAIQMLTAKQEDVDVIDWVQLG